MNLLNKLPLVALLCLSLAVHSQKITFQGLQNYHHSALTPIYEQHEVKGYMLYYMADRADRKNNNYVVEVLDENLNKVKSITITKPKKSYFLVRNAYNGSAFCFYFYNHRGKSMELETYDRGLNKLATLEVETSKYDRLIIQQEFKSGKLADQNTTGGLNLYAVPGKGFVRIGYVGMGKSYQVMMYDDRLKPVWAFAPEKSKDHELLGITEVNEDYVVGMILRRPGLFSTKFDFSVAAFDINTGKKTIDTPVETNSGEQLAPNLISYDAQKNNFLILGEFYKPDDKPAVDKSLGMFIKRLSLDGQALSTTTYRWDKDIRAMLPPAALQNVEDKYVNYVHQILQDAEGNMHLVAEQYKIAASGKGIAIKALGGQASAVKGKIGDMLIYSLDPSGTLQNIRLYEKGETDVSLPPGSGIYGASMLGHLIKGSSGFDYQFAQRDNQQTNFNIAYIDYNEEAEKATLVDVIVDDTQRFSTDRIDITSSKHSKLHVYPAKIGYNMLVEFNTKEERLDLRLVKLNKLPL
ncbi:MAG: DUF6770 family protein [Tunicatimonas sp.]